MQNERVSRDMERVTAEDRLRLHAHDPDTFAFDAVDAEALVAEIDALRALAVPDGDHVQEDSLAWDALKLCKKRAAGLASQLRAAEAALQTREGVVAWGVRKIGEPIWHPFLNKPDAGPEYEVIPLYAHASPQTAAVAVNKSAPERIWLSAADEDHEHQVWLDPDEGGTPYIRSDLALITSPQEVSEEWLRDTAMNVMLATEVEEAQRILTAALSLQVKEGE